MSFSLEKQISRKYSFIGQIPNSNFVCGVCARVCVRVCVCVRVPQMNEIEIENEHENVEHLFI